MYRLPSFGGGRVLEHDRLRDALDVAKAKLEALPKDDRPSADTILLTTRGTAWTRDGFKTSRRKACAEAGIADVAFHDLRGTMVTRLGIAGATPPEIATVTGHSLRDVNDILDRHYLNRDVRMAHTAVGKLESSANAPDAEAATDTLKQPSEPPETG